MKKEAGLYLHIPFCQAKCHYCAFNSRPGSREMANEYISLLIKKIHALALDTWCQEHVFTTIFVGGGTPSLAGATHLGQLLTECQTLFNILPGAEISLEANPHSVSLADLGQWRAAGFNRLSLGVQSFADSLLVRLGRTHTSRQAMAAVALAQQAGFHNINLDLIYAIPGQTLNQWRQSMEIALDLAPTHLALYELTIEAGTRFGDLLSSKKITQPNEDKVADMEELSRNMLHRHSQYEISNYALPGYECQHNINYWRNGPYLGIGAGAVSFMAGQRLGEESDPRRYMALVAAGESTGQGEDILSDKARFRETVIMGLRLVKGVEIAALRQRFGFTLDEIYGTLWQELCGQGLLVLENGYLRLPQRMLPLANQVLWQLV